MVIFENLYIVLFLPDCMRRKVVLHGPSTMTLSLPSQWVKARGVKKGDELIVEERGTELAIRFDTAPAFRNKKIVVGSFKRAGKSLITSSYRQGYDELVISYDDPSYVENIQSLLSKELTGFEIVQQTSTSCTLKDLTGHASDEFDTVLRRVWFLLIDMSRESYALLSAKQKTKYKSLESMDASINKFTNYCLRMLVRKSSHDDHTRLLLYHLIKMLEKIGDGYKDMASAYLSNGVSLSEHFLTSFDRLNRSLETMHTLFYTRDLSGIERLFDANRELQSIFTTFHCSEAVYLSTLCRDMTDLLSLFVEFHF